MKIITERRETALQITTIAYTQDPHKGEHSINTTTASSTMVLNIITVKLVGYSFASQLEVISFDQQQTTYH